MSKQINQPQIVGILNVTPDSFYDGGKYNELSSARHQLDKILKEGADIIDIGAESTRPNAQILSAQEEIARLEKILPIIVQDIAIFNQQNAKKVKVSIDSYHFDTIVFAQQFGIDIVNDISGLIDDKIINFISKNKLKTILMHNLSIHANPDIIINQQLNVFQEIAYWLNNKIKNLSKYNIDKSQLIFDPGIGFSKNAKQSINIIKNIEQYQQFGLEIYVGHSNKSFLDALNFANPNLDRKQKTLALSQYLANKGVNYLRVHDVKDNIAAITAKNPDIFY